MKKIFTVVMIAASLVGVTCLTGCGIAGTYSFTGAPIK